MATLVPTKRFERAFRKLSPPQQEAVARALETFRQNPRHPGLHFEKLLKPYRSIRVDRGLRVILADVPGAGDTFEIFDAGSHDVQDQYARRGRKR